MRRIRPAFVALFAASVLTASPASAETSLSLSDAIRLSRGRNAERLMAEERVRQAVARSWQAYTSFLPQVTADASQSRQTRNLSASGISIPNMSDPLVGPFNSFDARIRVNQIVLDGAAFERLLAVRAGERTARAQDKKIEEDVMALVAGLYLDARRAGEGQRLAESALAREKMRLEIAHRAHRWGEAATVEIKEAKAFYKESVVNLRAARLEARERLADLAVALGYGASEDIRFRDDADGAYGIPEMAGFEAARHPAAVAARRTAEQRRVEERIHWAEYFPKFAFMADYGLSGEEPGESEDTYTFGVKGSMPIFEGGTRPFRIAEAQSRTREASAEADAVLRRLETGTREALDGLLIARKRLDAKAARLAAALERQIHTQTRLKNGSGSEWEAVEAVFASAAAKDQTSQASADYLKAHVRLAHALGEVERLITSNGVKTT